VGPTLPGEARRYLDTIVDSARRMGMLIDDLLAFSRLGRKPLSSRPVDMAELARGALEEVRSQVGNGPTPGVVEIGPLPAAAGDPVLLRQVWANLLAFSRLGRKPLSSRPVDMTELARGALEEVRSQVGSGPTPATVEIGPLPAAAGDPVLLRQVWANLLGNAVKYSMQRPVARIEVAYRQGEGGAHEFEVSDNGAGFDMQYAGKLFGVFQRLHKASEFPGTGVGLASVRRILLRHGGRIAAEAEPGRGATFRFSIPAGDAAAATDPGVLPP
jgi:signal transduction histidine kinase